MKLYLICHLKICARPAPQGAGGLKCDGVKHRPRNKWSRPARGGWIEIVFFAELWDGRTVPPRKGRVD